MKAVSMKRSNGHVEDLQIAMTAVNPAPTLVPGLAKLLDRGTVDDAIAETAGDMAARIAKPLTTSALTPEYRREMIRVFTRRAVLDLLTTDN